MYETSACAWNLSFRCLSRKSPIARQGRGSEHLAFASSEQEPLAFFRRTLGTKTCS